jgi:hypothetical protein
MQKPGEAGFLHHGLSKFSDLSPYLQLEYKWSKILLLLLQGMIVLRGRLRFSNFIGNQLASLWIRGGL